jgi:EpsI family protein
MSPPPGHVASPAPAGEASSPVSPWRRFAPILALLAFAGLLFRSDFVAIAERWSLGNESHGLPIALLIPVMFWRVARDVPRGSEGAWLPAFVIGVLAAAAYVLLRAAWITGLSWAAIPAILLCAVWVALGSRAARAVALPLACLVFAIPIWDDFVTPVLQSLTVAVASTLVLVLGIPAAVEGNIVHVPAGTFEIAAGCAGTRYFVVSLATACLVAVLDRLHGRRLALAIGSAVALALVANWVRVVTIIAIGEASDMTSPIVAHHDTLGWWIYAAFLLPYFVFVRRLAPASDAAGTLPAASDDRGSVSPLRMAAAAALLALAPIWAATVLNESVGPVPGPPQLPATAGDWQRTGPVSDEWRPRYPGAGTADATYVSSQGAVDAFVGTYRVQSPGHKLVGLPSTPVAGRAPWTVTVSARARVAGDVDATELRLERPAGPARVLRYWYVVGGTVTGQELGAKARESLRAIGRVSGSSVVAISSPCVPDCTVARARLDDFGARWWGPLRSGL